MKILDLRQETSLTRIQPEGGFGDVGEGGIVLGIAGIDLPATPPADGQVAVYDAGTGQWIWIDPSTFGGSGGMTPYFIATGTTFTVPVYKQALYAITIDVEGTLAVNGILAEVD